MKTFEKFCVTDRDAEILRKLPGFLTMVESIGGDLKIEYNHYALMHKIEVRLKPPFFKDYFCFVQLIDEYNKFNPNLDLDISKNLWEHIMRAIDQNTISRTTVRPTLLWGDSIPEFKQIIYNGPATIVKWKDGTKTIVKATECETADPEKGFAMAFLKKCMGKKYSKVRKECFKLYNSTLVPGADE